MADILMNLDHVGVQLAGRAIFTDVSWEIQDGQRIGLVGPNGVGKSTLLRLMAQELAPANGNVFRAPGVTWGRLPQEPALPDTQTVLEAALTAVPELAQVEAALHKLEQQMGDPTVYADEARLAKVMAQHERQLHRYEQLDGAAFESRVKETLTRLGLDAAHWQTPAHRLSGGQKKLVLLAQLLVRRPRLLLLDEPDNHLDLASKQLLERVIAGYAGCVVIISHDRYLLDEAATHIAEMENGRLTLYPGNYTAYANARELRRLRQQQLYAAQQKEIARIEAAIARFEKWAAEVVNERHIRQANHRRRMLARMDKVEKVTMQRRMGLALDGWRGSNKVLELDQVQCVLENGRCLFDQLAAILWHGERVGLVGPNGAGKSFLLRQILQPQQITAGQIKVGPSVKIGYYAQEHETLTPDQDLISEIRQTAPLSREDAVAFLHKFLFTYRQMQQPIYALSGGERSRLQLAKLMLERPNLLLLDEPTNNLDILSIEVLEAALETFEGSVLLVSHDRYFLDQVVDRVWELRNGRLAEFDGGYTDYLERMGVGD